MRHLLSAVRETAFASVCGFVVCSQAFGLPVLPGNGHPHNNAVVTWPTPAPANQNDMHQHWNDLALGVNNGETSWFANKAWDNNGTTTAFRTTGSANFGHGFIANRVLYYFDTGYDNTNAYHLRVEQAFGDWVTGAANYFTANSAAHPGLRLGFNFTRANARPTEPYINIMFTLTSDGTTGEFDPSNQTINFNLEDFTWYNGAAAPGAGQQDFLTTARHEIGHAVGFGHNKNAAKTATSSVMWSSAAATGVRSAITNGDYEGVMALYTQPVPEPSTILAGLIAIGFIAIRRRKP